MMDSIHLMETFHHSSSQRVRYHSSSQSFNQSDEWSENEVQRVMKHTIGKGGEVSEINKGEIPRCYLIDVSVVALSDRVRPPCNCMIFHH